MAEGADFPFHLHLENYFLFRAYMIIISTWSPFWWLIKLGPFQGKEALSSLSRYPAVACWVGIFLCCKVLHMKHTNIHPWNQQSLLAFQRNYSPFLAQLIGKVVVNWGVDKAVLSVNKKDSHIVHSWWNPILAPWKLHPGFFPPNLLICCKRILVLEDQLKSLNLWLGHHRSHIE